MSWNTTNADPCLIEPGIGPVETIGSMVVSPSEGTDYTLRATGPGGTAEASLRVAVISPPGDLELGEGAQQGPRGRDRVGEGINLVSGNMTEMREDLRFPSPFGQGLVLEATYNSQSETEGVLGCGLSHSYQVSHDPSSSMEGREFLRIVGERGRLTGKVSKVLGKSYHFSRHPSPSGRVMEVEYPSQRILRYTRDSMGRMASLTMIKDAASIPLVTGMTYNPFGGPKGLSTGYGGEGNNTQGECGCLEVATPGSPWSVSTPTTMTATSSPSRPPTRPATTSPPPTIGGLSSPIRIISTGASPFCAFQETTMRIMGATTS